MLKRKPLFTALDRAFIRIPVLPIRLPKSYSPVSTSDIPLIAKEAIAVASPSLLASLNRSELPHRRQRQVQSSLLKYLIRMRSRTTPFGLFSGIAQVKVGASTDLRLAASSQHRHRTRLDMAWLLSYIKQLEQEPTIQANLILTFQPIVTRIGNRYHFEHWDSDGKVTNTSVIATSGVELLFSKTLGGKRHADLVAEMLREIPEATHENLLPFIDKFITYGIIRSSLRPPLTCADPARYALDQLQGMAEARPQAALLTRLLKDAVAYDHYAPGKGRARLPSMAADAQKSFPSADGRLPFAVDLALTFKSEPTVQQTIADDAALMAGILFQLAPRDAKAGALNEYRESFIARYGRQRLVSLADLLNRDIGLGLPSYYTGSAKEVTPGKKDTDTDRVLLHIAHEAAREKQSTIQLDDKVLGLLVNPDFSSVNLPHSIDISVQVAARSQVDVSRGDYLVVAGPMGGSSVAGRSAGRFADLLGNETTDYLSELAQMQDGEQQGCLYAELVYMPLTGHAANIAIRPALRAYEIVLNAAPSVSTDNVLAFSDLFIGVRDSHFYIWSAIHKKEIIVRHSHMLNTQSAPSICRFLIDVCQDRHLPLRPFSWGAAAKLPYLPRVTYGRLVLSLAEWKFDITQFLDFPKNIAQRVIPDEAAWQATIETWRKHWQVPRYVYLTQSDNRLLLDLTQPTHAMELFYAATAHGKKRILSIQEALPSPQDAWVRGVHGYHMNECIFQVRRVAPQSVPDQITAAPSVEPIPTTERLKMPGSDWLYCKLYIPAAQQNEYIAAYLPQLIRTVKEGGAADSWFFIRYSDPEPHIRLRFQSSEAVVIRTLLPIVMAWVKSMQRADLLRRFCIDTYDREIERYGGSAVIATAEAIFAAESELDITVIGLSENRQLGDLTIQDIATLTASILLTAFGLSDAAQVGWTAKRRIPHAQFANLYRHDRTKILTLLHDYRIRNVSPLAVQEACLAFQEKIGPLALHYIKAQQNNTLTGSLEHILNSLLHMHANRLLGTDRDRERQLIAFIERSHADLPKWEKADKA